MKRTGSLLVFASFCLFYLVFVLLTVSSGGPGGRQAGAVFDKVVFPPAAQLLLTGGDRFLAANFVSIRAVAGVSNHPAGMRDDFNFMLRSGRVVSALNPCHEDQYYVGNALFVWGGAVREGQDLLQAASDCRDWDEVPPFFLGFNHYYFMKDLDAARASLEIAAERAKGGNAAGYRKMAIMFQAGEIEDEEVALEFLMSEYERTQDEKLKDMLDKRIKRLEGLITLQRAQERYEERFGKKLEDPQGLIAAGELNSFPIDPLQLGYEFAHGRFRFREVRMPGHRR